MLTISDIFNVLSDENSLMLLNAIASGTPEELLSKTNIGKERYYCVISTLLGIGLVRKKEDCYYLTNIGKISYRAYLNLSSALDNQWKLKCIDILEENDIMPREELSRIINTIIKDHKMRETLIGQEC